MAVELNQTLKKGDRLLVLEAMKMQSTVYAPIAGQVTETQSPRLQPPLRPHRHRRQQRDLPLRRQLQRRQRKLLLRQRLRLNAAVSVFTARRWCAAWPQSMVLT